MCTARATKRGVRKAVKATKIFPLDVDETSKWCHSFVLVPKSKCQVRLYLHLSRLNKSLIRPIHRCLTLNDILSRLAGVKYIMFINVNSGHHSLNLNKQSSYLTTFPCPFGRYIYI